MNISSDLTKARIKNLINFVHNWFWNSIVKGLRIPPVMQANVSVSPPRETAVSDSVFKISRVYKCANRLRNGPLTGDIKFIRWA